MESKTEYKIDLSNLARLMLRWEKQKRALDELEAAIKDTVLQIGKTQTVGHVRATYNNPRKSYDYEGAADGHPMVTDATIALFTTPKIDWRGICKHADIKPIVTPGTGPGSVSIKLTG